MRVPAPAILVAPTPAASTRMPESAAICFFLLVVLVAKDPKLHAVNAGSYKNAGVN